MSETPRLTLYPYGGLGEIGLNSLALDYGESLALVDCGLMFPEDYHLGVDVVIPRFDHLIENRERLKGIVLTHGHEDHIGALPWLVPHLAQAGRPAIYGSAFTLALVEHKLRERGLLDAAELVRVDPGDCKTLGDFKFRFFPVCHSIIDGMALGIETPVGKILHTGDFKLDPAPLSGPGTDLEAYSKFAGKSGLRLLLSDSTNVENYGHSLGEREVFSALRGVFAQARGRLLVTLFASNIQRIQEVFDCARENGRQVMVIGRSLLNNIEMAQNLGCLKAEDGLILSGDQPAELPDDRLVLLVTGSQGEPMSALARIVWGGHKFLTINPGDTVIMSSRLIPGNTSAVNRLINQLYRRGASVLYQQVSGIHASGHAYRDELAAVLRAGRPEYFIPVHGEYRHLVKHAELAAEHGVDPEKIFILEDGQPFSLGKKNPRKKNDPGAAGRLEEPIPAESILVDGKGVGDVGQAVLKERQLLGDEGMVTLLVVLDAKTRETLLGPEIQSKGFIFEQSSGHVLENSLAIARDVLAQERGTAPDILQDKLRSALRRHFRRLLGRDPVVVPLVRLI
jgi:ribonuclease J